MKGWALLAADARTGAILDEIPEVEFDFAPQVGQVGQCTATITSTIAQAKIIAEGATVLHLTDDDVIFGGNAFLVNDVQYQDGRLTVTGDSLRDWFDRRNLRAAKTYTAQDQFAIVSDLLAYANAGSLGIGVTFRANPGSTSGVARSIAYPADRTPLGTLVDNLAKLDNGFDWDITAEWDGSNVIGRYLDVWYPSRGLATNLVWEHSKNCRVSQYNSDASKVASLVEIAGGTSTATQSYGVASASPAGFPRYDLLDTSKQVDETNTGNLATLNAYAAAAFTRNDTPIETCTVVDLSQAAGADTNVNAWGLGDQVTLAADLGFRVLSGLWRVTAASYKLIQGQLTVDSSQGVTLARPLPGDPIRPPDGFRELAKVARHVKVLERR